MKYINISSEKIVEIAGHNVTVKYEFDGGEETVMYYPDGSGYCGYDAFVEVGEYWLGEKNITDIIESVGISAVNKELTEQYDEDELCAYALKNGYCQALKDIICEVLNTPTTLETISDNILNGQREEYL